MTIAYVCLCHVHRKVKLTLKMSWNTKKRSGSCHVNWK